MTDPDPRFLLSNERTLLAWLRTALALIAGGLAVYPLLDGAVSSPLRRLLAVAVVLAGSAAAIAGYRRWRDVERAMRAGTALPPSRALLLLTSAVLGIGLGALAIALGAAG